MYLWRVTLRYLEFGTVANILMSFTARSPGTKHILLAGQSIHKTNNNHLFCTSKNCYYYDFKFWKIKYNLMLANTNSKLRFTLTLYRYYNVITKSKGSKIVFLLKLTSWCSQHSASHISAQLWMHKISDRQKTTQTDGLNKNCKFNYKCTKNHSALD